MSNCSASCTSVRSPLIAAIATFALKADVWFRRGLLLMLSPDSRAKSCPLSGRSSTYRPVQIPEAGSQIKNEIAALKADKSVPETEKEEGLAQLEAALKIVRPIQFKENIALVLKYFDKLAPLMQEQDSELRLAD